MAGDFLKVELTKAILLFLILLFTWHILYVANWVLGGLDWLLAYSIVLIVVVCFFIFDKQKISSLGFKKPTLWKRYIAIGLVSAVLIISFWVLVSSLLLTTAPAQVLQYGIANIPYNILFAFVVGLVEETSFRGYILRNLGKVYATTRAITYSSVLFGLYHISFVSIFLSTTSPSQTFTYWSSYALFAFVVGLFLGYFYVNAEQTTIGTITQHSSHIFLSSLVPFTLATSFTIGHLLSTSAYIVVFPLLIVLKRKGWMMK